MSKGATAMPRMTKRSTILITALGFAFALTACGTPTDPRGVGVPATIPSQSIGQPGGSQTASHQLGDNSLSSSSQSRSPLYHPVVTRLPDSIPASTVDGVKAAVLPDVTLGAIPLWSPSGNTFAYAAKPSTGSYIIGTLQPFRLEMIQFGSNVHVVAISDTQMTVTTGSYRQDFYYPFLTNDQTGGLQLGSRQAWKAATDAWQHWVVTARGPAVVTGGYQPATLALTLTNGTTVKLGGGEVYLSPDRTFGAVSLRPREPRNIHPVGGVAVLAENQPSNATSPISIWDFAETGGPKRLAIIRLPKGFTGLPPLSNPNGTTVSPAGHAAITEFNTTPILLQW